MILYIAKSSGEREDGAANSQWRVLKLSAWLEGNQVGSIGSNERRAIVVTILVDVHLEAKINRGAHVNVHESEEDAGFALLQFLQYAAWPDVDKMLIAIHKAVQRHSNSDDGIIGIDLMRG